MMRADAASEQLDASTTKGQWQEVYEAECGAQAAHPVPLRVANNFREWVLCCLSANRDCLCLLRWDSRVTVSGWAGPFVRWICPVYIIERGRRRFKRYGLQFERSNKGLTALNG